MMSQPEQQPWLLVSEPEQQKPEQKPEPVVTRKGAGRQSVSAKKDWCTPKKYVDAVRVVFNGCIALDPCSNAYSLVQALTEYRLPDTDGLLASWNFSTIYVNPPYGNDKANGKTIKHWFAKCTEAHESFGAEILALVPVATNTSHWKQHVFGRATAICFLADTRLKFLEDGKDTGKGAPMACAMVYWGADFDRFLDVFTKFGAVVDIRSLKKTVQ